MGEASTSRNMTQPLDPEILKIAWSQGIEVRASSSSSSSSTASSSPATSPSRNVQAIQQKTTTQVNNNGNEKQSQEENAVSHVAPSIPPAATAAAAEVYYPFNPQDHGLPSNFSLINYGDIRDQFSCPSHHDLQTLLATFMPNQHINAPITILTEETAVVNLLNTNYFLLETSNFITPMLNEPYYLGKIAFNNLMNGIYALGIGECTTHRMALSLPSAIDQSTKNIIFPLITQGYLDAAKEANVFVQNIRLISASSFVIGGNATSIITDQQIIMNDRAYPGDVLVLTKPIGTTVAIAQAQVFDDPEKKKQLLQVMSNVDVHNAKSRALEHMIQSNLFPAVLMRKFNTHAVCEVSIHGLYGHADILVKKQVEPVNFVINNIPIIAKMDNAAKEIGVSSKFLNGRLPEISGGLVVVMPRDQAGDYCQTIFQRENRQAWIIGFVEAGNRSVVVTNTPRIIHVPEITK